MYSTAEIMNIGMECLIENLGIVEAEQFISAIKRENFDYTKWQRVYYDRMPAGAFLDEAEKYGETHPYKGKGREV